MAKISNDKKSVTVEKNDTLSQIALDFKDYISGSTNAARIQTLVKLNDITNPNFIVIGQVIKLSGVSSSSSSKKTTNTNKATIKAFGIQTGTDRTMYATWTWTKDNTEHYEIKWYYATGDGIWFIGSDSTTKDKQCTYGAPSNATKVKFKVKPIAKKRKVNNKETAYWTASWSTEKVHTFTNTLDVPSGLSAEVTGKPGSLKLKAELENISGTATEIEFKVLQNNKTKLSGKNKATIKNRYASYTWPIEAGNEYKICCRAVKGKQISEWSDYETVETPPADSKGIKTLKARSMTSVYIDWYNVSNADLYRIQYTTDEAFFKDNSTGVNETTRNAKETGACIIEDLTSGTEYFFRVRAEKGNQYSGWTDIESIILGTEPSAPTTWSNTTTAMVGEPVYLYWTHNTADGSKQTDAELQLYVDGVLETIDVYDEPENEEEENEEENTYSYKLDTSEYTEGSKIEWKIRTAGITGDYTDDNYSDWSIQRTIDVYAEPTINISVLDGTRNYYIETLNSFPFYIYTTTGPKTQSPIGYHLSITANEAYKTIDQTGNFKMVNVDEVVYSQYFDIFGDLAVRLSADNIDLENNISYTITCVVSMNSGLTAETTYEFKVAWEDAQHEPTAEIEINEEDLSATIRPYLSRKRVDYVKVNYDTTTGQYTVSDEIIEKIEGTSVDGAYTPDDDLIYSGVTATGENVYFCIVETDEEELIENVTLSVYRREFDGSFTKILEDVDNSDSTYFHDPHPALDYARYRVVATDGSTGAVSYYDVPGKLVDEKSVVIQWNESWTSYDTLNEDEMEEQPSSCSMLKLPYNIDVSDKYGVDVSLIEYIGRKRPVSYYGTQLGESSTWNVVIEKDDEETLYALRRLAIWTGDVYVREPSGTGYWANITVSFSQKHCDLTIPVTLDIVRVEGGV